MQKELHATVRGRVQMVMYRDYARRGALRLGLTGTVQNLKDGTVEVFAQGEEEVLKKFIERLKKGSLLSRVDTVAVEWRAVQQTPPTFTILY